MRAITWTLTLLLVLGLILTKVLGQAPAAAPAPSSAPATQPAKIAVEEKQLLLTRPGVQSTVTIDLGALLPMGGAFECKVLHQAELGKQAFYLLTVEASSRPGNPNAAGGAGIEDLLVWLHFDQQNLLLATQMLLYSSYWSNLGGSGPKVEKNTIQTTIVGPAGSRTATFDRTHPERGIAIETAKSK